MRNVVSSSVSGLAAMIRIDGIDENVIVVNQSVIWLFVERDPNGPLRRSPVSRQWANPLAATANDSSAVRRSEKNSIFSGW